MTSSIGGIDLSLETPRSGFEPRLILDLVLDRWPNAVFQDAEASSGRPLGEVIVDASALTTNEFFIYQDEISARSWAQDGETPENGNRMLHFLVRDSPSQPDFLQITMVIGDFTVEMADLYTRTGRGVGATPERRRQVPSLHDT